MTAIRILAACAAWGVACALGAEAPPPSADRGATLYELRCTGCHGQSVHAREKRAARDFDSVRDWVERWNTTLKLGWEGGEVDDVAVYLNSRYYRFACPPTVCRIVSLQSARRGPASAALR